MISSQNNYVSESTTACQYIFKEEAYKCVAPESEVCNLPLCAASYKLYDASNDKVVANIGNGGTYISPPCNLNIEVVLPCTTTGTNVSVELLDSNGAIVSASYQDERYFLFGANKRNIFGGRIASGTYTIQAVTNDTIIEDSPATFTLSGHCRRNNN